MSWSVQATGKVRAVAVEIKKQIATAAGYSHMDKEEGAIATAAGELVEKALADASELVAVAVTCSGSLSTAAGRQHSLNISITPLWNWVD